MGIFFIVAYNGKRYLNTLPDPRDIKNQMFISNYNRAISYQESICILTFL